MLAICGLKNLKQQATGYAVSIGNYDGVHLGHQKVIERLRTKAAELKIPSMVIIFEPHPKEYFKHQVIARLTCLREKLLLLEKCGVDAVLCLHFNSQLAAMMADDFVKQILIKKLNVRYVLVGDDAAFGCKRSGNFALLHQYAKHYNFQAELLDSFIIDGIRVSSTAIRDALAQGDIETAQKFLGRPFSLMGRVIHGDARGRSLGFPTANISLPHKVLPLLGIYIVKIIGLGDNPLPGVASIGFRPTVGGQRRLLEVYILNFNENIYGKTIRVEFLQKIRAEQKFASLELLTAQIKKDVETAKMFFNM